METTMMVVAIGAIVSAAILFIVKHLQRSAKPQESAGFAAMGYRPKADDPVLRTGLHSTCQPVPGVKPEGPPPPMPQEKDKKQWATNKMQNKRGWKAPAGHHFNDIDVLVTDVGSLIIDMAMIAQLCGESYEASEPVGTETITSQPELIPMQAKDTGHGTPESVGRGSHSESHSESHSYSGGGGSCGCDSGEDSGNSDCGD